MYEQYVWIQPIPNTMHPGHIFHCINTMYLTFLFLYKEKAYTTSHVWIQCISNGTFLSHDMNTVYPPCLMYIHQKFLSLNEDSVSLIHLTVSIQCIYKVSCITLCICIPFTVWNNVFHFIQWKKYRYIVLHMRLCWDTLCYTVI